MQKENERFLHTAPGFFRISIVVILVLGILAICMLLLINRLRMEQTNDSVRMEALMDVKVDLSQAHLWLEESMSGNFHGNIDKVFTYLEGAKKETGIITDGGFSERGERLEATNDRLLKEKQAVFSSQVTDYIDLARQRLASPKESVIRVEIGARFEKLYNKLFHSAEEIEFILEEREVKLLLQFRYLFWGLLVFWISALLVSIIVIVRMERRRALVTAARDRAISDLGESEKRTTMAQKVGNIGIWDWNPNSGALIWSDEIYGIFGLTPGEIVPSYEFFMEMVHPDDKGFVAKNIEETLYQNKPYKLEFRIVKKDGELRIAEVLGEIQFDDNGKPERILGTFIDITERKQTEEALKKANEDLELRVAERTAELSRKVEEQMMIEKALKAERRRTYSILDLFPGFVYLQAQDHSIVFANKRFRETYGKPGEKPCFDVMWDRTEPCDPCQTFRVFDTKTPEEWVSEHTSNGRVYQVYDEPFIDTDGTMLVLEISIDITERKHAEEELRDQIHFFQTLIDTIPNPIFYKDANRKYLGCNKAFEVALGITKEELVGKTVYGFDHNELADKYFEMDSALFEKPGIQVYESKVKYASGEDRDIIFNKATFSRDDGTLAGLVGVMMDITEMKSAEKERDDLHSQLLHSQKMEAIGRLTAGIAHDFNNLMIAVKTLSSLGSKKSEGNTILQSYFNEINNASIRATGLTKQLSLFSRKAQITNEMVDINSVIKTNLSGIITRLVGKDISITYDLSPDIWKIKADTSSIEQVIVNLIVNAKDAMQEGGLVSVRTENNNIKETVCTVFRRVVSGEYVTLQVTDTGVGMDYATSQMIFDPFFTTKPLGKGTGLGLSVIYGIVNNLDGAIDVVSEPGEGTTFRIYLPASSEEEEVVSVENPSLPVSEIQDNYEGAGELIFLLEDDSLVHKATCSLLEESGYRVEGATTVAGARKRFEKFQDEIVLLLSDVTLPDGNGIELAMELVKMKPKLRVILYSGYADYESHLPSPKELGFQFIEKPFEIPVLLKTLKETIAQKEI